jgi:hypothetical protein
MSAWIVSKPHIDCLVQSGIEREMIRPNEADEFGRMLWAENLASIHYRYPDTVEGGMHPGPNDFHPDQIDEYVYEPMDGPAGISLSVPGVVNSAAACYDYQTCEHPEYEGSKAHMFAHALYECTVGQGTEGPWGIDARDAFLDHAAREVVG